ncbi:MAG: hypothetical protein IJC48_05340 [Clostridia bacterium]|nr:hypothetical protein [Clostridia bacterium]
MKRIILVMLVLFLCASGLSEGIQGTEWITIADGAMLADENSNLYPAAAIRKGLAYDEDALVKKVLGEDYIEIKYEYSNDRQFTAGLDGEPWEIKHIYIYPEMHEFSYSDPWVAGERGGEYQPPCMNMMPSESQIFAKALLSEYFDEEMLSYVSPIRQISDRWSYKDRWYTDKEYQEYAKNQQVHYIVFEHRTEDGIPIMDDMLMGIVGVNGLSGFQLSWHNFEMQGEMTRIMPLQEAINRASTTRSRVTQLLYADICYSNWLTDNSDEYHLSWRLVTADGTYIVDMVLNDHKCNMYEY